MGIKGRQDMANWSNYRIIDYEKIPKTEGTSAKPMYEISDEVKQKIEEAGWLDQQSYNGNRATSAPGQNNTPWSDCRIVEHEKLDLNGQPIKEKPAPAPKSPKFLANQLIEKIKKELGKSEGNINIERAKALLKELKQYVDSDPNSYKRIYADLERSVSEAETEKRAKAKAEERKKAEETDRNIRNCIANIGKGMAEARIDMGSLRRELAELKQYTNQYPGKYSKVYDEVEKRVNNAIKIEEKRRAEEYERDRAVKTERNIRNCIANIDKSRAEARMVIETFGDKRSESIIYIDILRRELAELKICTNQYPDKYSKIYDETERKVNAAIAREEEKIAKEEKQAVANRVITCLLYIPLWFVMAWLSRYVIGSTWSKIVWVILLLLHGFAMYGMGSDRFKDKKMTQALFLVEIIYYVIWWVSSGIVKLLIGNGWSILLSLVLLSGCIITSCTILDEPIGFPEFGKNLFVLIRKKGYRQLLDSEYMKSINDVAKFPVVIAGIEILLAAIVKFLSSL